MDKEQTEIEGPEGRTRIGEKILSGLKEFTCDLKNVHLLKKNMQTSTAVSKIKELELPYEEEAHLTSLVQDYGYIGARCYLLDKPWNPDRNQEMVEKHRKILEELE